MFLLGFGWLIEEKGYRKWAFPLVVVGLNSIAAYLIAHLFEKFFIDSITINLGWFLNQFGRDLASALTRIGVLTLYWLILWWMYRRKLFLKI